MSLRPRRGTVSASRLAASPAAPLVGRRLQGWAFTWSVGSRLRQGIARSKTHRGQPFRGALRARRARLPAPLRKPARLHPIRADRPRSRPLQSGGACRASCFAPPSTCLARARRWACPGLQSQALFPPCRMAPSTVRAALCSGSRRASSRAPGSAGKHRARGSSGS
jgi:hypothetical protein